MRRPKEDITGQKFNKLLVIDSAGKDRKGNSIWNCICDCGNSKITTLSNLKCNNTRSCGCDRRAVIEKMAEARRIERSSLIYLYRRYRDSAKQRNLSFRITLDELETITSRNCFYCNNAPSREIRTRGKQPLYIYNGIDRVDNSRGYEIDNVVAACHDCNFMKLDRSNDEFLAHIKRIYENIERNNL